MRIVSMVPSWTETLIEAGADVVGRTRFCIHPSERVKGIPAIGGTKNWDVEKLAALKPDLIILDQEENTREMGAFQAAPILSTHVRGVHDMPKELRRLAGATKLERLASLAERFERVLISRKTSPQHIPGVVEWLRKADRPIERIIYVIWKNPWMAVSRETYIGSMLELFVGTGLVLENPKAYPQISLEDFDEETTLLLFSTEPFPFARQRAELLKLGFPAALVDGEKWSWFGVRSLRFLEETLTI